MSNLDELIDLYDETTNYIDNYDRYLHILSNHENLPDIDTFLSSLRSYIVSTFPSHNRSLGDLSFYEQNALNEVYNTVVDARSSHKFSSSKKEIISNLESFKKLFHEGERKRKEESRIFLAYIDELKEKFEEETYKGVPPLSFFADKNISPSQLNILNEIEKEAVKNATLHFKMSKSSKSPKSKSSKSRSLSKGGNNTKKRQK